MDKPDYFPTLVLVIAMAGVMALGDTCLSQLPMAHAQSQEQAIENLEELLGQYDQEGYANQTMTQTGDAELAAASTRIAELEAQVADLKQQHEEVKHQHALLVSEYTTLKARCDGE